MHNLNKKVKIVRILSFFMVFLFSVHLSFGQEEGLKNIQNFSPTEYHSSSQNWAIIQDNRGVMYFGNSESILEYDGVTWRNIKLSNQSIVHSFAKDSLGNIYVGGIGDFGFLQADSIGKMGYHSLLDKVEKADLDFQNVWYTHYSGKSIFFVTRNTLFRLRNGEIKSWKSENTFGPCITLGDKTYVHSLKKGMLQLVGDSLKISPNGEFFNDKVVFFYIPLAEEKLLVGTAHAGLYIYDLSENQTNIKKNKIEVFKTEIDKLLKSELLYCGKSMQNEKIVLGTINAGAYLIDRQGKLISKINDGLRNNMIYDVAFDKNNNLWLATDNGISKVDINSPISFWDITSGINNAVDDIERFNDTLFFSGFGGMYYIENNQAKTVPGLTTEAYCLIKFKVPDETSKEILLSGTRFKKIAETSHSKAKQVIDKDPWDLFQSNIDPSLLYISDDYGLHIAAYKNQKWELLGKVVGIACDVRQIKEDKNGEIWLSTYINGIIRILPSDDILKPRDIIRYGTKDGLLSIKDTYIYNFDNRFIFVSGLGIYRFDESINQFIPDSTFGSAYCDGSRSVITLTKDNFQRVWISGKKDDKTYINVLMPNEQGEYILLETNNINMLPSMMVSTIYSDNDSIMWIGGTEGLYRIKGTLNDASTSYNTLIRNVIAVEDTLYFGTQSGLNNEKGQLVVKESRPLNYSQNSVEFQYASPFFRKEKSTVYQTWLEGLNKDWSLWSPETEKHYLNLFEGTYSFHVRAKNINNDISTEAVYEFIILPPLHRTFWAYLLYFFFLIGLIYLIVYFYSKRLKTANLKLEKIIKERTHEVEIKNNTLEKQKEKIEIQNKHLQKLNYELGQTNEEIQAQSEKVIVLNSELQQQYIEIEVQRNQLKELLSTRDRLFSIIAHDLKSPFNSLIGLSDILSTDLDDFSAEQIQKIGIAINQSAKSGFKLLENLLAWALSQTGRISYEPENIDINEMLNEVLWSYTGIASQKDSKLLFEAKNEPLVFIDKNMIHTVIRNLVSNAIKFTHRNGSIIISTSHEEQYVLVSIKDTGLGISKEDQSKLFRMDTIISTQGTENEKGTGLGLLLCKEFVEKNKGKLALESSLGKGSTFTIKLPVAE
jgi:signal transduction histidine kinase